MANILLVEDDDSVREFVTRALMIDRHGVTSASDGEKGLEIYQSQPNNFDLVLSDILMPAMDGIAMCKAIAENNSGQKILLMTGFANQRERAEGLDSVIVDVVQKPFSLPEIRKQVNLALAA